MSLCFKRRLFVRSLPLAWTMNVRVWVLAFPPPLPTLLSAFYTINAPPTR